jgi:RecB family endonuclease NucS
MDIIQVLSKKYSNYLWHVNDSYESLIWDDSNDIPKPTLSELETSWAEMNIEKPYEELRIIRNKLLSETDFMFTTDYSLPNDVKEKWVAYRQTLRDLPQTSSPKLDVNGILTNVTFPVKPV